MYSITISPQAKKELKSISKLYRKAIARAIDDLSEDPFLGKPLTREPTGKLSYRVGVYRVVYKVSEEDKKVYIISAGHRRDVYE